MSRRGRAIGVDMTCVPLRAADGAVRGAIVTMELLALAARAAFSRRVAPLK